MIGMSFSMWLTLLILGFIGSVVLHFAIRYRMLAGADGFFSKWILGWLGGWLGSPVLGHWGPMISGCYVIPALIGAFALPFVTTAMFKALTAMAVASEHTAMTPRTTAPPYELKKAS